MQRKLLNKMPSLEDIYIKLTSVVQEITDIDNSHITWETNIITDLAIDSLDFLDIIFAIDKAYNIHLPVEQWLQETTSDEERFTVINICKEIKKFIDNAK